MFRLVKKMLASHFLMPYSVMSTLFSRHCEGRNNPENTTMRDCFVIPPTDEKYCNSMYINITFGFL